MGGSWWPGMDKRHRSCPYGHVCPLPHTCPHDHAMVSITHRPYKCSHSSQVPPWPCGVPKNPQNSPKAHCAPQPVSPVILAVKGLPGMCLSSKRTMML